MAIEDLVTKGDLERFIADQVNSPGTVDVSAINNLQATLSALQEASTPLGWVTPALAAGWSQYENPEYSQVAYRVQGKRVDLRGLIAGEPFASSLLLVLPADLAPERRQIFPVHSSIGVLRVDVGGSGQVIANVELGEGGMFWISLDSISFWAAD